MRADAGYERAALVPVTVRFRALSDDEIEHYLRTEQPYDCAGSAKVETLGIALLESLHSDDPTSLVGTAADLHVCNAARGGNRSACVRAGMTGRLYLVPNTLDFGVSEQRIATCRTSCHSA